VNDSVLTTIVCEFDCMICITYNVILAGGAPWTYIDFSVQWHDLGIKGSSVQMTCYWAVNSGRCAVVVVVGI